MTASAGCWRRSSPSGWSAPGSRSSDEPSRIALRGRRAHTMSRLSGARVLVTGAGGGIGAALVDEIAGSGACVLALDLAFAAAGETRANVERAILDVRDAAGLRGFVARSGPIDVLINNAGVGYYATVEEADPTAVAELFAINVHGTLHATQAVLPGMRMRRSGTIALCHRSPVGSPGPKAAST